MRSIESSDPKLIGAIAKAETDEELKSDFEAMTAHILLYEPVSNNKANSNQNEKWSVSDAGITSMVGVRDQETKSCLRFYVFKEGKNLS